MKSGTFRLKRNGTPTAQCWQRRSLEEARARAQDVRRSIKHTYAHVSAHIYIYIYIYSHLAQAHMRDLQTAYATVMERQKNAIGDIVEKLAYAVVH